MSPGSTYMLTRRTALLGGAGMIAAGCTTLVTAPARATSVSNDAMLTARLGDVRSVREIKRLQHAWCHFAEAGQWADMADLFVSDGGVD